MKPLFLLLLLCLSCLAASAQSVVLSNPNQTYHLFSKCEVLTPKSDQMTIDSLLLHPEKYPFVSVKQKPLDLADSQTYWFRVTLTNQTHTDLFLHFIYFIFSKVTIYEVTDRQVVASQNFTKSLYNGNDNYYQSRRIFPLKAANGQTHRLYFYATGMFQPSLQVTAQSGMVLQYDLFTEDLIVGLFCGFILMIVVYSLLLYIRLGDQENLYYMGWVLLSGAWYLGSYEQFAPVSTALHNFFAQNAGTIPFATSLLHLLFTLHFLPVRQQAKGLYWLSVLIAGFYCIAILLFLTNTAPGIFYILAYYIDAFISLLLGIAIYRKGFKPALFFILGNTVLFAFQFTSAFRFGNPEPPSFWAYYAVFFGAFVEILIFTFGLSYKVNLLKKHQDEAIQEQLRLTQENQQLIESQNRVLEEKVEQRTAELRASQAQLIQKEKLASLGELTAGIAHEIQNPLNFVNNFSEVSTELVDELKEEAKAGRTDDVLAIADDLTQNLQKITHHGSRASAIVRGMLEHSRASTGEKQPTNLNALADEYLRLAYQGLRAKNQRFNCELDTRFATDLPHIDVVPQDMGRVLLNLYNNAFYAVQQKQKTAPSDYQPTVWVNTARVNGQFQIRVRDNGTGIPDTVKEKIFQPFFTTKPTGEGTGLGLSLSYDIVTKGHGGMMTVESREGEGPEFVITLPV